MGPDPHTNEGLAASWNGTSHRDLQQLPSPLALVCCSQFWPHLEGDSQWSQHWRKAERPSLKNRNTHSITQIHAESTMKQGHFSIKPGFWVLFLHLPIFLYGFVTPSSSCLSLALNHSSTCHSKLSKPSENSMTAPLNFLKVIVTPILQDWGNSLLQFWVRQKIRIATIVGGKFMLESVILILDEKFSG